LKKNKNISILCRVPTVGHSTKNTLPSVRTPTLSKVYFNFFKKTLPSARDPALGKVYFKILKKSLPSAHDLALGKVCIHSCSPPSSLHSILSKPARAAAADQLAAATAILPTRRPHVPAILPTSSLVADAASPRVYFVDDSILVRRTFSVLGADGR
jgi:hypothetical protein